MSEPARQETPARTLPRRANTIRALAASFADRKLTEVNSRQAVSDKIGYAVAVLLGAIAYRYGGRGWVAVTMGGYLFNAWIAHRRWKQLGPKRP